jgi:glycosyltransferase involved in cell wall biosynthesis
MKWLHVISSMNPRGGGPCQCIRNLVPIVREGDHHVEVVCLDDPKSSYLTGETVSIHALGKGIGSWSYHPKFRPWLEKNLRRFDAVILNGIWQYPAYVLSRLARDPNVPPYFVFPHGMLDPWFQRTLQRRLKAIRNWLYWKLIEHEVIRRAEAVFCTCAEEMRLAQQTFRPYQPKRQVNVGYGSAQPPGYHQGMAKIFAKKCPGIKGRRYFLFLGRIHPKKGVDLLIQAYAKICNSTVNAQRSATCLVIAGPGLETDFGKRMFELAAITCPPDRVFWPGMLTGDAKWGALYNAEAFVLPSHQENFGIAVAEALSCGTPVLISNQINIWREIEEDHAGFVGDDTLAGAEQVLRSWEARSPEDHNRMKRAAQLTYETRFAIVRFAQNLLTVLEESTLRSRTENIS